MRLPWVVLALALAAPSVLAAPGCEDGQPCTIEVTIDPSGTLSLAQPDIPAGKPLVLAVTNEADHPLNVTLDGTPLRIAVAASSTATSPSFVLTRPQVYVVREDVANTTATLTISAPVLSPEDGDGGTNLWAVVLPVIVGLALIGVANVVVRSGREHRHNLFFAGLYMLSGLKSMSEGLSVAADDFHAAAVWFPKEDFWELLGTFCALGLMPLLFLFVSSFPRPMGWLMHRPRFAIVAFVPSVIVVSLLFLWVLGFVPYEVLLAAGNAFNVPFFAVMVFAVVRLVRTRSQSPDPIERTQSTYVLLGFLPAFATGWAVSALQLGQGTFVDPRQAEALISDILLFVSPILELVACSLVGFAILKYNILGVNPRFRLGVKSALFGAMVVALFLVTQFVENVILQGKVFSFADDFTGGYGSFILSGATSLVLFRPIEKVSGRVSDKLLPAAAAVASAEKSGEPAPQAAAAATLHTEQIYHAQCTYVLRDAHVTERELALLRNLRAQLGLDEAQARRIEEDVERLLKVDAPETGAAAVGTVPATAGAAAQAAEIAASEPEVQRGAKGPPT